VKYFLKMVALGYMLLVLGLVVWIYGQVRFLVMAYKRNLWWFLGVLFVPLVDWIFLFLNFRTTIKPFGLILLGLLVAILGGWMSNVTLPTSIEF